MNCDLFIDHRPSWTSSRPRTSTLTCGPPLGRSSHGSRPSSSATGACWWLCDQCLMSIYIYPMSGWSSTWRAWVDARCLGWRGKIWKQRLANTRANGWTVRSLWAGDIHHVLLTSNSSILETRQNTPRVKTLSWEQRWKAPGREQRWRETRAEMTFQRKLATSRKLLTHFTYILLKYLPS